MKIPPRVLDEFTFRGDLNHQQKYRLRHPDKYLEYKVTSNTVEREKWAKLSTEEKRARHLWKQYKLTFDEYNELLKKQNFKCTICDTNLSLNGDRISSRAVVDHCHKETRIRSILCDRCNRTLGIVEEDTNILKNMIHYLESHSND